MNSVIQAQGLDKSFGSVHAVRDVSFEVEEHSICGLLGRNGAGKSTVMSLLTGQTFASSGSALLFGESPVENPAVLSRTCFIKESQVYPDGYRGKHVLRAASWIFPGWDRDLAARLVDELSVPLGRRVKRMSRGQRSALGVVVGIASRAELTVFDEPYAGLDAVARRLFYDRLLQDYVEHPRTILMSTHLIDEVAELLDRVVVIDEGRIIIDSTTDDLRGSATTVAGKRDDVLRFVSGRDVLTSESLGGLMTVTVEGLSPAERALAVSDGLEAFSVSLQQLVIGRTGGSHQKGLAS